MIAMDLQGGRWPCVQQARTCLMVLEGEVPRCRAVPVEERGHNSRVRHRPAVVPVLELRVVCAELGHVHEVIGVRDAGIGPGRRERKHQSQDPAGGPEWPPRGGCR